MHDPFYNATSDLIQVNFLSGINDITNTQTKLSEAIANKIQNHDYFYGIEISARSMNQNVLDYNLFKIQPLFTSIIWIGEIYAVLEPFKDIPALKCMDIIRRGSIVMPHLTCYRMTSDKIKEILTDSISNVLALQGDKVDENQNYKHAIDLVKEIKNLKKNNISIGVGGYPEVHPNSASFEEDLDFLKSKIDAGADFIITQLCFSEINIKKFIQKCRQKGINVPIIPGIYVPNNFHSLKKISEITKVKIPQELFKKFENLKDDREAFQSFAEDNAYHMIKDLLDSNLNIYGVQFFTLNHFQSITKIVNKLFIK